MVKINAIGETCPVPVIKAKKALETINYDESILISVDNITSTENLGKLAYELGFKFNVVEVNPHHYDVSIIKKQSHNKGVTAFEKTGETVVVISSNTMGNGDSELGMALLKAFIYTLTELDESPNTIIFYNGGATLPVDGSNSLEDLKKLENLGVEIITCGVCLEYYKVKNKLSVGSVTNMYTILEKLNKATKIINP